MGGLGRHAGGSDQHLLVWPEDIEDPLQDLEYHHLCRYVGMWRICGHRNGGGVQSQEGRIDPGRGTVHGVHVDHDGRDAGGDQGRRDARGPGRCLARWDHRCHRGGGGGGRVPG